MRKLLSAAPLLCLAVTLFAPVAAHAADPIFPQASHIGLVPVKSLTTATAFPGFEDKDAAVKVVVAELPPQAFPAIEAAMRSETKAPGAVRDRAEMFMTNAGFGILSHESAKDGEVPVERWGLALELPGRTGLVTVQVPRAKRDAYPADVIRTMLASVSARDEVPVDEQIANMPFRLKDLADFKTVRTIVPRAAILLSDRRPDDPPKAEPYMILSVMPGGPARPEDRPRFAEQAVFGIQGLENIKLTSSEPLRLGGQQGFETRFTAKDATTGDEMAMIQWIRFGNSGFLLMIAGAPKDEWSDAFPRFRKVRDGIERP